MQYTLNTKLMTLFLASFIVLPCFNSWSNEEIKNKPSKKITLKLQQNSEKDDDTDNESETEKKLFSYNFELDLSRFIWKGISISRGAVLSPYASISAFNFELDGTGYYFLNNENYSGTFSNIQARNKLIEGDFTLSYNNFKAWNIDLKPFVELYVYPYNTDPTTTSLNFEISYNIWLFKLFTNQSVLVTGYPGTYYSDLGFSFSKNIINNLDLDASIKLDLGSNQFNKNFFNVDKFAFDAIELNLSANYTLFDYFYIKPHIEFSSLIDSALRINPIFARNNKTTIPRANNPNRNRITNRENDIFNIGLTVGYLF